MKRLLCIVGSMNAGGAETFLMKIYRCLDKSKYKMDFAVATQEKGYYDDEILSYGGKIYHISPKSAGMKKNFDEIKGLVREHAYESVLRISQHSLSAIELLAAKQGGAKIVAFRSSNSNTTTGRGMDLLLHKLCKFMPKTIANVRFAPSTEAAEFMFGKNCIKRNKAQILHNAIDLNVYKFYASDRERIRDELGVSDKFVIGHVGRFNQQKNHCFLLDIFAETLKLNPNCVLMLVGKGELEEKIRSYARELGIYNNVIFTGVRSDVPMLLSAMDSFVFPSLYEGMPNTVIEAQATGLPCIVADTITKEADITGTVRYLPLELSAEEWAKEVLMLTYTERVDTSAIFIEKKYDIQSVAHEFEQLVFLKDE